MLAMFLRMFIQISRAQSRLVLNGPSRRDLDREPEEEGSRERLERSDAGEVVIRPLTDLPHPPTPVGT